MLKIHRRERAFINKASPVIKIKGVYPKISVLNQLECKADPDLVPILRPYLEYKYEFWQRSHFGMKKSIQTRSLISLKGIFSRGLLHRAREHLKSQNIAFDVVDSGGYLKPLPYVKTPLPGITLRPDQERIVTSALTKQRGIIISATGSGKTCIAASIINCFPNSKVLFLCHTIGLVNQTAEVFEGLNIKCSKIGNKEKPVLNQTERVIVSTIQSFIKYPKKDYQDMFDVVIVDEVHHASKYKSQYGEVLQSLRDKVRIGLTATLPAEQSQVLMLEGLFGEIIEQITVNEGVKEMFLVKPKVKLLNVPINSLVKDLQKYPELYKRGIVENRARNNLIINEIKEYSEQGKTCLVMVKEIDHGNNIIDLAGSELSIHFVQGRNDSDEREEIKKLLNKKKIDAVISTSVWREGINIPSLNVVINAASGKSDLATMQTVGRGIRTAEGKTELIMIDFLDPYKYLAEHSVLRIQLYNENGWL
jgi:superfamily II DNA or RNA helicase